MMSSGGGGSVGFCGTTKNHIDSSASYTADYSGVGRRGFRGAMHTSIRRTHSASRRPRPKRASGSLKTRAAFPTRRAFFGPRKIENFNKNKKGRALRKPSLVGADLFAQGLRDDIHPSRATTKLCLTPPCVTISPDPAEPASNGVRGP